jgi:hypothetical protein
MGCLIIEVMVWISPMAETVRSNKTVRNVARIASTKTSYNLPIPSTRVDPFKCQQDYDYMISIPCCNCVLFSEMLFCGEQGKIIFDKYALTG